MKMRFQRHGRQFFFFTFCVEGRRPVLSWIVKGRGFCPRPLHGGGNAEVHTEMLPVGEAVIAVLKSLHGRNPALTASDRVVMPDHVHFVLIVDFDKDPGFEPLVFAHRFMEETARDGGTAPEPPAATQRAEQEAWGARGAAPPVLWHRRFWLVLSFSARQLSAIRHYIRHNPARAHVAVAEANVAKAEAVAGAMAEFRVVFEKRTGVSVPQEAVLSRAADSVVFVAEQDGTAKEVPVRVGLRDGGRPEILEGLTAGAPVIVQGQTQLCDGRKIAQ